MCTVVPLRRISPTRCILSHRGKFARTRLGARLGIRHHYVVLAGVDGIQIHWSSVCSTQSVVPPSSTMIDPSHFHHVLSLGWALRTVTVSVAASVVRVMQSPSVWAFSVLSRMKVLSEKSPVRLYLLVSCGIHLRDSQCAPSRVAGLASSAMVLILRSQTCRPSPAVAVSLVSPLLIDRSRTSRSLRRDIGRRRRLRRHQRIRPDCSPR